MKPTLAFLLLFSTLALHTSTCRAQGTLTPPGPPAPTMISLGQMEPRTPIGTAGVTITNSGSYYLTANLSNNAPIITISANDVSLDLRGFSVAGMLASSPAAIIVSSGYEDVWIGNGSVRDSKGNGLDTSAASNVHIENIRAYNNSGYGINAGNYTLITACEASDNGEGGINIGVGGTVKDCVASGNIQKGISALTNCAVLHCNASNNGSNGITATNNGTTVSQCTVSSDNGFGIIVGYGCVASDCTVYFPNLTGIFATGGCVIRGCSVYYGNADGIDVVNGCQVLENDCGQDGVGANAGIRCLGPNNRIEGNHIWANFNVGINCGSNGPNFVIKNSAGSNPGGNYVNTNANQVGPIGSAFTSTSPWANLSF